MIEYFLKKILQICNFFFFFDFIKLMLVKQSPRARRSYSVTTDHNRNGNKAQEEVHSAPPGAM